MSSETPSLPPRKSESSTDLTCESDYLKTATCLSPLALLIYLETNEQDHQHVFKSVEVEAAEENGVKPVEVTSIEDFSTLPTNDTVTVTHLICQSCHTWLHVTHTNFKSEGVHNQCPGTDYPCHHYHAQGLGAFQCCGCEYTLATEVQDPVLPINLFKRLEATRPKAKSFADMMQKQNEQTPTMVSTLTTVLIYIKDLLNGMKRNINSSNPHFLARIGLSDGSQALLEAIGFQLNDQYYIAPDIENGTSLEARLMRIQKEIILVLDTLRLELGATTVPKTIAEANMNVKKADMQGLLGVVHTLENRYTTSNDYLAKAYAVFGLTSGASDKLVSWTYTKLMEEATTTMDPYDALDSLLIIANMTNSDTLQTLIACERSKGKIARTEIGDAYAYFGVNEESADDRLLIGLYQVKLSDEPLQKNLHQDKLKIIAIARHSSELIDFLKEEKGITTSANTQSVEDIMGVPANMINTAQNKPVGLNNIGNTCYFNSLLQYYFTFVPFRETMINNKLYVEDENSEPKKIGGIEVDQSEVRRAKKFVELLEGLFINLQETNEKAISPEVELAYMALLNVKDEEVVAKETEKDDKLSEVKEEVATSENVASEEDKMEEASTEVEQLDVDTEMKESSPLPSDPINQGNKSTSDVDIEYEFTHAGFTANTIPPPKSPPPAYDEIPSSFHQIQPVDDKKPAESSKPNHRPSVDTMMFGKQQDVTECMGNVMYLVEAALKPLQKTQDGEQIDDMIRQLFYGKARQILSYVDNKTMEVVKKNKEEDFSHVIVDACEGKTLYDGLDEYFFADKVENFQGGQEATREVTVTTLPPVLQVLVQRVQFDRATANVYKSNAYVQFEKIIYLDRYLDENFTELKDTRNEVAQWRSELDKHKKAVDKYSKPSSLKVPAPDLIDATNEILRSDIVEGLAVDTEIELVTQLLGNAAERIRQAIKSSMESRAELRQKIDEQYKDYTKNAYKIHAVFIHQGQANYGHYWIYILDHVEDQWWKYNDSLVTKVDEQEVFHDTTGSTANPYFLVYVDANKLDQVVETIVRRPPVA
ncbi:unnamed protein product [Mucor hiemalis]